MKDFLQKRTEKANELLKIKEKELSEKREKALLAKYDKAVREKDYFGMRKWANWLQTNFGYDADFTNGIDDGEPPHESLITNN